MNAGRPSQGSKQAQDEKMDGSATDSGEEIETEHEQSSGQEFATLMENIQVMDRVGPSVCWKSLQAVWFKFFGETKYGYNSQEFNFDDRMLITSSISL